MTEKVLICGIESLNNYLKLMSNQQAKKDNNQTFVLEDELDNPIIVGFYTLTMTAVDIQDLSEKLNQRHKFSASAGLIARLAVNEKYKGKGFGEWLLVRCSQETAFCQRYCWFPFYSCGCQRRIKIIL